MRHIKIIARDETLVQYLKKNDIAFFLEERMFDRLSVMINGFKVIYSGYAQIHNIYLNRTPVYRFYRLDFCEDTYVMFELSNSPPENWGDSDHLEMMTATISVMHHPLANLDVLNVSFDKNEIRASTSFSEKDLTVTQFVV